jgi:hypothetical protein
MLGMIVSQMLDTYEFLDPLLMSTSQRNCMVENWRLRRESANF